MRLFELRRKNSNSDKMIDRIGAHLPENRTIERAICECYTFDAHLPLSTVMFHCVNGNTLLCMNLS